MPESRETKKIGIFGHVGTKNLGDEAIIAAVIQNIRERCPGADIVGFTTNPEDTSQRHGIPCFPIRKIGTTGLGSAADQGLDGHSHFAARMQLRLKKKNILVYGFLKRLYRLVLATQGCLAELRFLAQCRRSLKGIDVLVIAGSNQLNDYVGGAWAFPYTLLKWSAIAKLQRTRLVFLNCGAGPISTRLGRFFLTCSLSLADYKSYRDQCSRKLIDKGWGENTVGVDLAYGLKLDKPRCEHRSRLIVGINPLPFFDDHYWPEHNREKYDHYVRILAAFAQWLNGRGYIVRLFPTQLRADTLVIEDIKTLMKDAGATLLELPLPEQPMRSLDDLISSISMMDIVVATRYHGILISALLCKPILAIAYAEKSRELMAQIGQAKYAVDIDRLNMDTLIGQFISLEANATSVRQEVERRLPVLRETLSSQYDQVFGLLAEASGSMTLRTSTCPGGRHG